MKIVVHPHRTALLLGLLALLSVPGGASARQPERIDGQYIVVYHGSVGDPDEETDRQERNKGFKSKFRYRRAVKGFAAKLSRDQVKKLEDDPDVAFVSPDRPKHAVGSVPLAAGDSSPTGVRRIEAATTTTAREASDAKVAVIDTGADLDHSDLDVTSGRNCVNSGSPAEDDNGHGTHVTGTIAARNQGSGVVGVAPATSVYAVKVLDATGNGTDAQVICGIDWVTATRTDADSNNNIQVVNMSLGGTGSPVASCSTTTDALHKAICDSTTAGVTYVVAAGNSGWDFDFAPAPDLPAAYPEVLTVSAMSDGDGQPGGAAAPTCRAGESDDRYATFSNFAATAGGRAHTIAGPGVCIRSTWLAAGYNTISGTSMATPHVAGAVALCTSEGGVKGPCDGLTPAQVIDQMRQTAQDRTTSSPGYGFTGDPAQPVAGKYFGYLAWARHSSAAPSYRDKVVGTSGLVSYWRLGESSGTVANDEKGANKGSYLGGPALGQPGALTGDANTAVGFDGVNDELTAPGPSLSSSGSIEGWFNWSSGAVLMRDNSIWSTEGWILAYDLGGSVAYRVGGKTFTTSRSTASLQGAWHHIVLTVSSGNTAFYIDGALVHSGTGAPTAASKGPWHLMRNGTSSSYTNGRADEPAIYNNALPPATVKQHYDAR